MPFQIIRNNLTAVTADAIVNTANPKPLVGSGVDAAVHAAAGPELLKARQAIGRIRPGQSVITPAYNLQAKFVVHTVGPRWVDGQHNEAGLLRSCYDSALTLAWQSGCRSIAFPLISTGNYGFPRELALEIATAAFRQFLKVWDMDITLVVFDREAFRISGERFRDVASFIDETYVDREHRREYEEFSAYPFSIRNIDVREECCAPLEAPMAPSAAARRNLPHLGDIRQAPPSLSDLLAHLDAGFSETLLNLIDSRGKTDAEVYKKANVDRKLFSKIRNNPDYKPSKATALAFAVALELNLEETEDFLGRAGFALSHSSKFDVIIEYFIRRGNYNIFEINEALFAFDQALLGAG